MSFIYAVTFGSIAYIFYRKYVDRLNQKNRAATDIVPVQERVDVGRVRSTFSRPMNLPPRGQVTAAMGTPFSYSPVWDEPGDDAEHRTKVLNIANKYYYG